MTARGAGTAGSHSRSGRALDEHWVLTPGNAAIWYQTVLAFLAQHVLGEPWRRPELL
jgi:hypothetical protein